MGLRVRLDIVMLNRVYAQFAKALAVSLLVLFTIGAKCGPTPDEASFTRTGDMTEARASHTATLLPNRRVLVVGGYDGSGRQLASAELYDPTTGKFTATGSMHKPRALHTATLLPDGQVLIVGGGDLAYYPDAELYDPDTGTFQPTGPMLVTRFGHTSTLLLTGIVLVAGGIGDAGVTTRAERYISSEQAFTSTNDLTDARSNHTATPLALGWAGKVLIAGGARDGVAVATTALYDTYTMEFAPTGDLEVAADGATATLLANETVLIAGGLDGSFDNIAKAQLYL
jgi:hypothetical protein